MQPSGAEQPILFFIAMFSAVTSSMGAGDDATVDIRNSQNTEGQEMSKKVLPRVAEKTEKAIAMKVRGYIFRLIQDIRGN